MDSSGGKELEFTVRLLRDGETYGVRYVCECGCRPQAKVKRGSQDTGSEHCCCGIVHFAGADALASLQKYLATRRDAGQDVGITYAIREQRLTDPWGEPVSVAYASPLRGD